MALRSGITFYQNSLNNFHLGYEKRELILIVGIAFMVIGLMGVGLPMIYAIIISIAIYFGIKVYAGRKKKAILKNAPEGLCAICGEKIIDKKCPNCDSKNE